MTQKWCVVNLGDAGRSPRMRNHIEQIASNDKAEVDYLTFVETEVPRSLLRPNVHIHALDHFILHFVRALPLFLFYFWLRFVVEVVTLQIVFALRLRKRYDFVLVQNPYSLPVLWLLLVYRLFSKKTKVIVDVHNFGYTLLGNPVPSAVKPADASEKKSVPEESMAPASLLHTAAQALGLIRRHMLSLARLFYKCIETNFIGLVADEVLVVSKAMKEALQRDWGISADRVRLLYDAPNAATFKPLSVAEKHEFISQFKELNDSRGGSILAALEGGKVVEKKSRPLIVTVSSSWGVDDDFQTLIAAVELYKKAVGDKRRLEFFFSGTGPLKTRVAPALKALSDEAVRVHVKWFEDKDYARIIGCSDFTLSVHRSTSGVDLPIKVLDSFACEVPVIALKYAPVISELVSDANGYLYESSEELCAILREVSDAKRQKKFSFAGSSWQSGWSKAFKQL